MSNKKRIINLMISVIIILSCTLIYYFGVFDRIGNQVNDFFFQKGEALDGTVSMIEIDEKSLDVLGPYNTWTRDYVAEAIEILNEDPELAPDVIGIDVLYIGNTTPDADEHLVNACGLIDNVVLGSYLNIDSVLQEEEGEYSLVKAISLYEEPFEEVKKNVGVGFVNGFTDKDGFVRHCAKEVKLDDGRVIPSFDYAIYQKYAKKNGMEEELDIPLNEDGYWYLNYSGFPGDYSNNFSLCDLLNGEIPPEYFADGVVLIGPYAEGLMDSHKAAIEHDEIMYGVEVHANTVDALIKGDFKKEVSKTWILIIIAVILAGACVLMFKNKLLFGFIYACIFVIGYPLLAIFVYDRGVVLDVVYIPAFSLLVLVLTIVRHYVKAASDKKQIESTFKRYVAPEIIEEISKSGLGTIKLGGDAVDCAILFVDIRGFTSMSEKLRPEEVVTILNKYLELTSGSIFKFEGTLDKYIGDATMAIFGAPLPLDDYIFKAVAAAWDMVKSAQDLSGEIQKEFGQTVSFGIGVHCGKAVVGNIGTQRRTDYTAIGDTVNTAARLEANAPRDTVYISKAVRDSLGERIKVESIGVMPLKGKQEEIEVFKVLDIIG